MSFIIINECLKFLKIKKIEEFICIKNYYLHGIMIEKLFIRFVVKNRNSLSIECLEKSNYQLYSETIDIKYLMSHKGKGLLKKIRSAYFCGKFGMKLSKIIGDDDVKFLSFCKITNLKELYLSGAQITDKTSFYLINCDFKNLKKLSLSYSSITDETIKYLIISDFENLEEINLSTTKITNKAIYYLIRCNFKHLKKLSLSHTLISDTAIECLTKCNFKQLKIIEMQSIKITDEAIKHLVSCNFENIEEINLSDTMITDRAIECLIKSNFKKLKIIDLSNIRKITNKTIDYFIECDIKLEKVFLFGTSIKSIELKTKYPKYLIHLSLI